MRALSCSNQARLNPTALFGNQRRGRRDLPGSSSGAGPRGQVTPGHRQAWAPASSPCPSPTPTEQAEPVGTVSARPAASDVIGHQALWILKEPRASGITSCPWRPARGRTLRAALGREKMLPLMTPCPESPSTSRHCLGAGGPQSTLETPRSANGPRTRLPRLLSCSREDRGLGECQRERGRVSETMATPFTQPIGSREEQW